MGLHVSIDNGGTLTDVCGFDGTRIIHAKTITTPHDLTECFVSGLEALSIEIFGEADLPRLIAQTDTVRYSTTQGTNAIVQRKGPRIGWLTNDQSLALAVREHEDGLFTALVGERLDVLEGGSITDRERLIAATTNLVAKGANRIVVGLTGASAEDDERAVKRLLYRAFPRHLLGAVPLLFSTELAKLGGPERRIWTALVNAFLHPAMERFLFNAEKKLRVHRARNPLLVFRNDGGSTRVARTEAIKTYSSGPQGGVVGAAALVAAYEMPLAATIDIGGTTTDLAVFRDGAVAAQDFGRVEGAPVSLSLADIKSIGAGGGSIIRVESGVIRVGPESTGAAPGPACFARGGTSATITDALLLDGVLDPDTYFGGRLKLDASRAEAIIRREIAEPLDLELGAAVDAMKTAYHAKIAEAIRKELAQSETPVLVAFGGAGPMSAAAIAEAAGLSECLIPRFAAVFSAYGISFSSIEHSYRTAVAAGNGSLVSAKAQLTDEARRGMLSEGFDLGDCTLAFALLRETDAGLTRTAVTDEAGSLGAPAVLELTVTKPLPRLTLAGGGRTERRRAVPTGARASRLGGDRTSRPTFRLEELQAGDWGDGPCLVEEAYFTTVVDPGWCFVVTDNGDLALIRR